MAISARTLFHFTSLENLKSILECKYFNARYSKEQFTFRQTTSTYYVPMVSFCDIPLTQTRQHVKDYGGFAIGLSKEWGVNHGLNPVFYIHEWGLTVILENLDDGLQPTVYARGAYNNLFSFMKPYKGQNLKNPEKKEKVFYDEKEWRFIPHIYTIEDKDVKQLYLESEYSDQVNNAANGHRFFKLEFKHSDIRYLITNNLEDKSTLITFLKDHDFIDPLVQQSIRVLTVYEIYNDF